MPDRKKLNDIRAVLFDLDGTLIDTAEDFVKVLNALRIEAELSPLPAQTIRNVVSDGARALTRLGFGGEPGESEFETNRQKLLDRYLEEVGNHAELFPGMDAVLNHFESSGIKWGIVTNKPRIYSERLLARLELDKRCGVLVCPDDITQSKPDPEGVLLAAQALGAAAERCAYVGDHARDIAAGKAAGMQTIAVKFGYIEDPDSVYQWQPDCVIEQAGQLLEVVPTNTANI